MNKLYLGVVILGGAGIVFAAVAVVGEMLGARAPDHASFACTSRLRGSPETVWKQLTFPERRTEIRQSEEGIKYEALEGDTTGTLSLLYEPPYRMISHSVFPNSEVWMVVTLKEVDGGTLIRVEQSAMLHASWHRLLFPLALKQWAEQGLKDYARLNGQQEVDIARDVSPPLAFTLFSGPPPGSATTMNRSSSVGALEVPDPRSLTAAIDAARAGEAGGPDASDESLPELGEFVHVEELPEAIEKIPPVYPAVARATGVEGTVMVHALVGKDGRVKKTRVMRSIPMLDKAAVTAVEQWSFKPARGTGGAPVAVWVAIPVKFTLH